MATISLDFRAIREGAVLGTGWSGPEGTFVWSNASTATLALPVPVTENDVIVSIFGSPFCFPPHVLTQRVSITVDDTTVHDVTLEGGKTYYNKYAMTFIVPNASLMGRNVLNLRLEFPDAASPSHFIENSDPRELAFALDAILVCDMDERMRDRIARIDADAERDARDGTDRDERPVLENPSRDRLDAVFDVAESMGDDCEFGLFQRAATGFERPSLLRFASIHITSLIHGIKNDFRNLALPESFELPNYSIDNHDLGGWDFYYTLAYHLPGFPSHAPKDEAKQSEMTRLRFLARKFLEDIEEGEKLFFIKKHAGIDKLEIAMLLDVIHEKSDATSCVVWVEQGVDRDRLEHAHLVCPGLIKICVDRLGPTGDLSKISIESWSRACVNAHEVWKNTGRNCASA